MNRSLMTRLLIGLLAGLTVFAWAEDREKQVEELNELSSRFNRYTTNPVKTEEREFIHQRVEELLRRARASVDQDYVFGRLTAAIDDFLDASGQIEDALEDGPSREDTQERAARELEDTYFDLMQGEHFARQSGDPHASDYISAGRKLYQSARAAYEQEAYAKARDLAEAAREIVAGLESLAQAAVRIPTPPRL